MDGRIEQKQRRWWVVATLLCMGLAALVLPRIAETSQTDLGISQPPLVTIIFDSSGSMQWTEKGEATYPTLSYNSSMTANQGSNHHLDTWRHGEHLNLPRSSRFICGGWCHFDRKGEIDCPHLDDMSGSWHQNCDQFSPGDSSGDVLDTITSVGPCMVWHPLKDHEKNEQSSKNNTCRNYDRPPPCDFHDDECDFLGREFGDYRPDGFEERMEAMVDDPNMRLTEDDQTPRHIQIKQILTGDMSLNGSDGPGCWFVPRARGAISEEQVCCNRVVNGRCYDDSDGDEDEREYVEVFESYVDYDDPVPHYQEVYDSQGEGLLDMIGTTGIFSMAMFDGYRGTGTRDDGWNFATTDIMAGSSPYSNEAACGTEDSSSCDNLGLFRWVGPTNFAELDPAGRMAAADYVQDAILDAGFLTFLDGSSPHVLQNHFHSDYDGETFDYPLGKQPIAQSSPIGPAFHDLHQFYVNGQQMGVTGGDGDLNPSDIDNDPYRACRARHSVIFTDGMAEPEARGGAGEELGSDILTGGGFGYEEDRFPYKTAEDAIEDMIAAAGSAAIDDRFTPKVHVIGAGLEGDLNSVDPRAQALRINVLDKLATMAEKGQTCAQYYLPPEMVPGYDEEGNPIEIPTGQVDDDGNTIYGSCDLDPDDEEDAEPCLALQRNPLRHGDSSGLPEGYQGYPYCPPGGDCSPETGTGSDIFDCDHPALVLTENDRDAMRRAFTLIFNEIAGTSGLSATTRPSITNQIDRSRSEAGQYRIYSGLHVAGDNPHWQGLLNRQFLECGDSGTIDQTSQDSLHEDMARLRVDLTDEDLRDSDGDLIDDEVQDVLEDAMEQAVDGDRRRIFTSVPFFVADHEDVDTSDMDLDGSLSGTRANESAYFQSMYKLHEADNPNGSQNDVFGDGDYDIPNVSTAQANTRVPFYFDALEQTFLNEAELDSDDFQSYWRFSDEEEMKEMIDDYRGRTAFRGDRMLGAIRNSNPVSVGAPSLDLPIDTYREFQRRYSDRVTMTYMSTLDGQLRAIHTGEPGKVRVNESFGDEHGDESDGIVANQREAWAYIPQLLHRRLIDFYGQTAPDSLMDGSPVVRDVRLCQRGEPFSANKRVCPETNRASEWRTVLVQGMGLAGSGYFALDVTRSGNVKESVSSDPDEDNEWEVESGPDPVVLWEFGPDWEAMQLQRMDSELYAPTDASDNCLDGSDAPEPSIGSTDIDDMWELSTMGSTIGEPAIGAVNLQFEDDGGRVVQRPVAVLGAGTASNSGATDPFTGEELSDKCTEMLTGKAVYVVDLQSGQLLRRFVETEDNGLLEGQITGTPVLSGTNPGEVSTRGFVGDSDGRMLRIDFTSTDPAEWELTTFFDPREDLDGIDEDDQLGPAAFRPALTMGRSREIVLVYGLGQQDDAGGENTTQMMIAVRESFEHSGGTDGTWSVNGEQVWHQEFEGLETDASFVERLTGAPVIFNNDAYFTTYIENVEDRCDPGYSRIYRLHYRGQTDQNDNTVPWGRWDEAEVGRSLDSGDVHVDGDGLYIQTVDPMLIRGMAITMGPNCALAGQDTLGSAAAQRPQLVAQTGAGRIGSSEDASGDPGAAGGGSVGGIGTIAVDLEIPDTQSVPVSWSILEH